MNNPGTYTASATITTAGTQTTTAIEDLEGMLSLTAELRFVWGAGGTTCKAYLQTSLDSGTTWHDIACAAFTTSSATKLFNLSGLTAKTTPATPTDGTMTDDTALDGVLGTQLRLKVISVGTYSGSTQIVARLVAR